MTTYFIEIYNAKFKVYRTYHITAENKQTAITRAINDQLATTPRYQIEITEARVD